MQKLTVGNSLGARKILNKSQGDGIELTSYSQEFEKAMAAYNEGSKEYLHALKELADN